MANRTEKGQKKNIYLLGLTSFFNDIGGEMLIPILPIFLSYLGASGFVIGITSGLRESIPKILQVFAGFWSDKAGKRKQFVVFGYFFSGVSKFLLALSTVWPLAVLFSATERVGKGIREAPRDAIIAESGMKHGKAFAIHKALDTAGGIVGSILVFLLFEFLHLSFATIIFIAALVIFISLIPVSFVKDVDTKPQKINFFSSLKNLPKKVWIFIIVAGVFSLANFGYMFIILKAQSSFSGDWIIAAPLLLYILFNIVYASLSIPFGIFADNYGRKKIVLLGFILFVVLSLILAFYSSLTMLVISFILFGLVYAILQSQQRALVADLSPSKLNGTAIGAFNTVTGLVALPSGFISGYLWDLNYQYTFLFGASVCVIAIILFLVLDFEK